ncbi:MAG: hypothetical protein COB09_14675 [Thalassobium sp.]|nr:MAG: hypothetical protein COB09_14675 [Thalassobium sp.]
MLSTLNSAGRPENPAGKKPAMVSPLPDGATAYSASGGGGRGQRAKQPRFCYHARHFKFCGPAHSGPPLPIRKQHDPHSATGL